MERIICTLLPFPLSTISAPSPMISDWASRLSGIKGSHAIASRIMCTTNATSAAIRPDCAGRHTREPVLRTKPEQTVQSCVDKSRLIWQWTISCFCQNCFYKTPIKASVKKLLSLHSKKSLLVLPPWATLQLSRVQDICNCDLNQQRILPSLPRVPTPFFIISFSLLSFSAHSLLLILAVDSIFFLYFFCHHDFAQVTHIQTGRSSHARGTLPLYPARRASPVSVQSREKNHI